MNLLIFLDLTYNPYKNFKFYSLQGQNFKSFLIFTYNQGKVFLILPITTLYNVCAVPWGVLSTVRGGVQYRGGYHEYRGGVQYLGGIS